MPSARSAALPVGPALTLWPFRAQPAAPSTHSPAQNSLGASVSPQFFGVHPGRGKATSCRGKMSLNLTADVLKEGESHLPCDTPTATRSKAASPGESLDTEDSLTQDSQPNDGLLHLH